MSLEITAASYGYNREKPLFRDLGFSLARGEIMAILGPNGVGKTTLLNNITGIMPWLAGDSLIDGKSLSRFSKRALWQRIGYVPQARANAFAYTVLDMVLLGRAAYLGLMQRPGEKDRDIARKVLTKLEIAHLEDSYCNSISGGELQLVFIARALVGEPDILFLDEPESHLDFKKQLIILDIIDRLAHEDGLICVMNTHFPNHALRIADKVLMLSADGRHDFGPVGDVLTEASVRDCFGVDAAITDIETPESRFKSIYPLSLSRGGRKPDDKPD